MNILTLETTCDETAAAVVTDRLEVLGAAIASQDALHQRFGGVVPEIASRAHVEAILPVIDQALAEAGLRLDQMDAVAVANTPGLAGSLLVGLAAAKSLAVALGIPLVAVNHLQAHIYACRIAAGRDIFPCVGLIVSGGHSSLYRCLGPLDFTLLGGTIDDAAGEAFDKVAGMLGLPYPGGPAIEAAARGGNPRAFALPRAFVRDTDRLDFSFSGLKTAVRYALCPPGSKLPPGPLDPKRLTDLAASFQAAVIDCLAAKALLAIERTGARRLCVGGGVAANTALRERLTAECQKRGVELHIPPPALCTDNAVMGAIAVERLKAGLIERLDLDAYPAAPALRVNGLA
jgi:N6-L-threonylcarbamoyladenine synthase